MPTELEYLAVLVCVMYVGPLFLVMGVGPGAVKKGLFLLGCFLPPVFLIGLAVRIFLKKTPLPETTLSKAIVQKACGPFSEHLLDKHICWEGAVILRRFILVVVITLVINPVTRMLVATFICLVILLAHILIKPYKSTASNVLECVMLVGLCMVACVNLVKALFTGLMVVSAGPMVPLLEALDTFEFLMVTIIPAMIVVVVIIFVFAALLLICCSCCRRS